LLWGVEKGVSVRLGDSIEVITASLAVIGSLCRAPSFVVVGAVHALWNAIYGLNVCIEKDTGLVAAVSVRVVAVVFGLSQAVLGAEGRVVIVGAREGVVGVAHIAIIWSLDGSAKFDRTAKAGNCWRGWELVVTYGVRIRVYIVLYIGVLPLEPVMTTWKLSTHCPVFVASSALTAALHRAHLYMTVLGGLGQS